MDIISEQDQLLRINSLLPIETGIFKQKVVYTSLHVEGSILTAGSEQGTVWVLDKNTNKLIKEIAEFRVCVTLVQLSSHHSFIAIGFNDGTLAIVNYLKSSAKKVLKDKDSSPITTFLWYSNGDRFLFGCKSGKLMSAKFDRAKAQLEVSHLLDLGAPIVQLSLRNQLLAISTHERPFLLEIDTGKLTQIGSRDRKPGSYGGCFCLSEDYIVVARPGLRLWISATDGKVQSTAKFKDVLFDDLPVISLFGGVTTTTTVNEAIQFGILVPWVNQWVICYHGNTVFVLEPQTLKCIGAMSLGQRIADLCTHNNDIYMLVIGHQRLIVNLSLHSPKPVQALPLYETPPTEEIASNKTEGALNEGTSNEGISVDTEEGISTGTQEVTSYAGSIAVNDEPDDIARDGVEKRTVKEESSDISCSPVITKEDKDTIPTVNVITERQDSCNGEEENVLLSQDKEGDSDQLPDTPTIENYDEPEGDNEEESIAHIDTLTVDEGEMDGKKQHTEDEKTRNKVLNAVELRLQNQVTDLKGILSNPLSKLGLARNEPSEESSPNEPSQPVTADIKAKLSKPLGKLALVRHTSPKEEEKPKEEPLPSVPLSTDEVERRMQMLQIPNEEEADGVAIRSRKTKKRKKKSKMKKAHQKITPLSSAHSSVEALDEIGVNDQDVSQDSTLIEPLADVQEPGSNSNNADIVLPVDNQTLETGAAAHSPLVPYSEQPVNPVVVDKGDIMVPATVEEMADSTLVMVDEDITKDGLYFTDKNAVNKTNADQSQQASVSPSQLTTDEVRDDGMVSTDNASSSSRNVDQRKEDLLSSLDRIWSAERRNSDNIEQELEMEAKLSSEHRENTQNEVPVIMRKPSRRRANAVRVNQTTELFGTSPLEGSLFSDNSGNKAPNSEGEGAREGDTDLLTFLNKDDTLTRSSIRQFIEEQEDDEEIFATEDVTVRSRHSSHSISSSYSIEETSNHPLFSGDETDTETEDEDYQRPDRGESVIASDYYSLVDQLVSRSNDDEAGFSGRRKRAEAFVPLIPQQLTDDEGDGDGGSTEQTDINSILTDSWEILPQPSRHTIQSLCLSSKSIWLIDARSNLFWCHPTDKGKNWQGLKKHVSQISSSADGSIVWSVHNHQAYVRQGINESNPVGSIWVNITRGGSVSRKIKSVSCDYNGVWALATDGRVLFRRDVSSKVPDGKVWIEAKSAITFVHVACCGDIVWALDMSGGAYVRENVGGANPAGTKWREVDSPNFNAITVFDNGIVWGIDGDDRLWFKCGATSFEPEGSGHWWEARIGSLNKPVVVSGLDAVWKVRSFEMRSNSFLQNVTSKLVSSTSEKFQLISGCAQTGICLLSSDTTLHACWNPITGYHRQPVCTEPLFTVSIWKQCASFDGVPWAVRDDGELFCFPTVDKSLRVECQDQVRVLAVSPAAVWALTQKDIWSRQGICNEIPQGYSWDYIELGSHMQSLKIKQLAIGNNVAWAVDNYGKLHFRFGIHPREPGTGMAPAWIEVPDNHSQESSLPSSPLLFESVVVSSDDWLVWALDQNGTPYARKGVTTNFPVGRSWEIVKGEKIKAITAGSSSIFALTVDGELLRRNPITERLPAGTHWRRLPGKFEAVSAMGTGSLLLIEGKGTILKQRSKTVMASSQKDKEALEKCFEEEWDVL